MDHSILEGRTQPVKKKKSRLLHALAFRLTLSQLPDEDTHHALPDPFTAILKPRTDGHGQELAVAAKTQRTHTSRVPLILPDPPLGDAVPKRHEAVSTA